MIRIINNLIDWVGLDEWMVPWAYYVVITAPAADSSVHDATAKDASAVVI